MLFPTCIDDQGGRVVASNQHTASLAPYSSTPSVTSGDPGPGYRPPSPRPQAAGHRGAGIAAGDLHRPQLCCGHAL